MMSLPYASLLRRSIATLTFTLGLSALAHAAPYVQLEAGTGDDLDVWGLSVGVPSKYEWPRANGGGLSLDWQARLQRWHSTDGSNVNRELWIAGFMPVWRWTFSDSQGLRPYVEAGIGVNALSQRRIGAKYMGSNFQFNEILGAGLMFGPAQRYRVSLDLQHVSNGGLTDENPGATFGTLGFQARF